MAAVAMVLRVRLRQHWKSWLAMAALVALVGGFVMAAAVTARRTAAAFPGFAARHGYDAIVYSNHPLPELTRFPQVARVTPILAPFSFVARCVSCRKQIDPAATFRQSQRPRQRCALQLPSRRAIYSFSLMILIGGAAGAWRSSLASAESSSCCLSL